MKSILLLIALFLFLIPLSGQNEFLSTAKTIYKSAGNNGDLVIEKSIPFSSFFVFNSKGGYIEHLTVDGNFRYYANFQKVNKNGWGIYKITSLEGRKPFELHYSPKKNEIKFFYPGNNKSGVTSFNLVKQHSINKNMFLAYVDVIKKQTKLINQNKKRTFGPFHLRGMTYHILHQQELALKNINVAIDLVRKQSTDKLEELYQLKGSIYFSLNDTENAIAFFSKAISYDVTGDNYYAHYQRGLNYLRKEEYLKAKKDLVKAINIVPETEITDRHYMHIHLGDVYNSLCDRINALGQYDTAISLMPENYLAYFYRANLHKQAMEQGIQGAPEKVIADLNTFLNNYSAAKELYVNAIQSRGWAYSEIGEYDKAIADLELSIKADSTAFSFALLGDAKRLIGDYKNAIKDFTTAIQLSPDFGWAFYRRGWTKEFINDFKGAIEDYSLAIKKNPEYAYTYLSRGELLQKEFNSNKGKKDLQKVILLDSIPLPGGNARPFALFLLGKEEEALSYMIKATEKYPTASNYYDLACVYAKMGQVDNSFKAMNNAINKGYKSFKHISVDDALENLRDDERFQELLERISN